MNYKGFYINLERAQHRRDYIESEFARFGVKPYTRFAGYEIPDTNFTAHQIKPGELGCFYSHYNLLKQNIGSELPLHIIEDDIILSNVTESAIDTMLGQLKPDDWDIFFTDVSVPVDIGLCRMYKAHQEMLTLQGSFTLSLVDLKEVIFGSTCSYVVNPKSIEKIVKLLDKELIKGAESPIDLLLRQLCRNEELKCLCIFPFVTSIHPEVSANDTFITGRFDPLPAVASNILRHSFFINCDIVSWLNRAQELLPQPKKTDLHRQLMSVLLEYSLVQTSESP